MAELVGFARVCGFVRRDGGGGGRAPAHLWPCAERWGPRWPGSRAFVALCGEMGAELAGFPLICSHVRKDARQSQDFGQEVPGLVLHGSIKGVSAWGERPAVTRGVSMQLQ